MEVRGASVLGVYSPIIHLLSPMPTVFLLELRAIEGIGGKV